MAVFLWDKALAFPAVLLLLVKRVHAYSCVSVLFGDFLLIARAAHESDLEKNKGGGTLWAVEEVARTVRHVAQECIGRETLNAPQH